MSFDEVVKTEEREFLIGLNPFRAGQCLSTIKTELREFRTVSIPFDQGNVFRLVPLSVHWHLLRCLNPFRSGQCLSTGLGHSIAVVIGLNPFRSGQCLSTDTPIIHATNCLCLNPFRSGQCLSTVCSRVFRCTSGRLNPFRSGQCLSTAAVCWRQESCGLSDPLPNFFGRLRSWLLI